MTVVRSHKLAEEELISAVEKELADDFNLREFTFLKRFEIPRALPKLTNLQYSRDVSESLLTEHIAVAGDNQLNGSLNAAMIAGESAAEIAHRATSQSLLTFA